MLIHIWAPSETSPNTGYTATALRASAQISLRLTSYSLIPLSDISAVNMYRRTKVTRRQYEAN